MTRKPSFGGHFFENQRMVAQISSDYEFSSCSNPLLFLTSRFHVAESLFSNRTQNEKVVHEAEFITDVLITF